MNLFGEMQEFTWDNEHFYIAGEDNADMNIEYTVTDNTITFLDTTNDESLVFVRVDAIDDVSEDTVDGMDVVELLPEDTGDTSAEPAE